MVQQTSIILQGKGAFLNHNWQILMMLLMDIPAIKTIIAFEETNCDVNRGAEKVNLGGVATQKNRTVPQISILGLVFFRFFRFFFFVFFGSSILTNFDWFNRFLLSGTCWLK